MSREFIFEDLLAALDIVVMERRLDGSFLPLGALPPWFTGLGRDGTFPFLGTFLEEAAHILENPTLTRAAEKYHEAAHAWNDLAECALPDEVDVFRKTKALMTERYDLYWHQRPDAIRPISAELETMRLELDRAFPMTAGDVDALFDTLHYMLNAVYDAETEALALLRDALQSPAPVLEIQKKA